MKKRKAQMSVYDQIKSGLEDSIAHARGELSLVTLDLPAPPPAANSKKVAAIRRKLRMSQSVFAATLNVSTKTVQSWEQGLRTPSDASLRLLEIIGRRPDIVNTIVSPR